MEDLFTCIGPNCTPTNGFDWKIEQDDGPWLYGICDKCNAAYQASLKLGTVRHEGQPIRWHVALGSRYGGPWGEILRDRPNRDNSNSSSDN